MRNGPNLSNASSASSSFSSNTAARLRSATAISLHTTLFCISLLLHMTCGIAPRAACAGATDNVLSGGRGRRPRQPGSGPGVVAGARVLRRIIELHAEALRRVPHPARVVEKGARHRHHVGLAFGDGRLGLVGVRTHPPPAPL